MEHGKVRAMALDVLENEKLNTLNAPEQLILKRLTEYNKIILTPHIRSTTTEKKNITRFSLLKSGWIYIILRLMNCHFFAISTLSSCFSFNTF